MVNKSNMHWKSVSIQADIGMSLSDRMRALYRRFVGFCFCETEKKCPERKTTGSHAFKITVLYSIDHFPSWFWSCDLFQPLVTRGHKRSCQRERYDRNGLWQHFIGRKRECLLACSSSPRRGDSVEPLIYPCPFGHGGGGVGVCGWAYFSVSDEVFSYTFQSVGRDRSHSSGIVNQTDWLSYPYRRVHSYVNILRQIA